MPNTPPQSLIDSAPPGTVWFGGPVERSRMSLRIMAQEQGRILTADEKRTLSELLKTDHDGGWKRHWSLTAPESNESNLDWQVDWIFSKLTSDLEVWDQISQRYRMDIFSGLSLERTNGGVELSFESMRVLSERKITIGFDIYFEAAKSE